MRCCWLQVLNMLATDQEAAEAVTIVCKVGTIHRTYVPPALP